MTNLNKKMLEVTKKFRAEQLEAMHNVMCCANDEEIYMHWVTVGVPDEPSREDFLEIAADTDEYNAIVDLFIRLVQKDGYRA